VEALTLLVHFLREQLGLTGTHVGCDTANAGGRVIHLDGRSVKSCAILAVQADGSNHHDRRHRDGEQLHPMQEAFASSPCAAVRVCTPGMIMRAIESRQSSSRSRTRRRSP